MEPVLRAPLNVEWEITRACNLQCKHCYTSAGKKEPKELTTQQALRIIDHLDEVGISDLTISGGEPLLRDDLEVIVADLAQREIPFALYTNGTLLSRERQVSLKKAGVSVFSLSLNGTTKETHNFIQGANTFHTIIKRIAQLKKNGFYVHALYTLMKANLKEAVELPSFMDDIKLDALCIYPFYPTGRGADHLTELQAGGEALYNTIEALLNDERIYLGGCLQDIFNPSLIKKTPCGRLMCLMTSEGNLRPCNFLPFKTEESLIQKDVYTLWKSPVFEKVRQWQKIVDRDCQTCEYVKTCRGNCLAFHMPFLSDKEISYFQSG